MVFVLAREAAGLGEAEVGPGLAPACDQRHRAIEHFAALAVGIESLPDEVANHAARLRNSFHHRQVDRRRRVCRASAGGVLDFARRLLEIGQRIRRARRIRTLVAQEGDDVTNRGEADAHHHRVLCGIDEFIDRTGIHGRGPVDDDRLIAAVGPTGDRLPRVCLALLDAQGRQRRVEVECRVRQRRGNRVGGVVEDEFVAVHAGDRRCVGVGCDGQAGPDPRAVGRHSDVALPTAPDHRVALAHQEAGTSAGSGVENAAFVEVERVCQLVAAVDHVIEQHPAGTRCAFRPKDRHVDLVFDPAVGRLRRSRQIDDAGIGRMVRVEPAGRDGGDRLVDAGAAEGRAAESVAARLDLEAADNSRRGRGDCVVRAGTSGQPQRDRCTQARGQRARRMYFHGRLPFWPTVAPDRPLAQSPAAIGHDKRRRSMARWRKP